MSTPTPVAYPNKAAELRQRLLGRSNRPPKAFTAKSGCTYWLKVPTLAQRGKILDGAGVKPKDGEAPSAETMSKVTALAAIALVVDEEGRPVFEGSELENILAADLDSEVAEVAAAAGGMLGGGDTKTKAQAVAEAEAALAKARKELDDSEGEGSGGAGGAASPTSSPRS